MNFLLQFFFPDRFLKQDTATTLISVSYQAYLLKLTTKLIGKYHHLILAKLNKTQLKPTQLKKIITLHEKSNPFGRKYHLKKKLFQQLLLGEQSRFRESLSASFTQVRCFVRGAWSRESLWTFEYIFEYIFLF